MPSPKKPRKKYRPKPVLANPLGYILEGLTPVEEHKDHIMRVKIINHGAMDSLVKGAATKEDIGVLLNIHNIMYAIDELQIVNGSMTDDIVEAGIALKHIADRCIRVGKYGATGPEIQALNVMIEYHDDIMQYLTLHQLDKALAHVRRTLASGTGVIRLPVKEEA